MRDLYIKFCEFINHSLDQLNTPYALVGQSAVTYYVRNQEVPNSLDILFIDDDNDINFIVDHFVSLGFEIQDRISKTYYSFTHSEYSDLFLNIIFSIDVNPESIIITTSRKDLYFGSQFQISRLHPLIWMLSTHQSVINHKLLITILKNKYLMNLIDLDSLIKLLLDHKDFQSCFIIRKTLDDINSGRL